MLSKRFQQVFTVLSVNKVSASETCFSHHQYKNAHNHEMHTRRHLSNRVSDHIQQTVPFLHRNRKVVKKECQLVTTVNRETKRDLKLTWELQVKSLPQMKSVDFLLRSTPQILMERILRLRYRRLVFTRI